MIRAVIYTFHIPLDETTKAVTIGAAGRASFYKYFYDTKLNVNAFCQIFTSTSDIFYYLATAVFTCAKHDGIIIALWTEILCAVLKIGFSGTI